MGNGVPYVPSAYLAVRGIQREAGRYHKLKVRRYVAQPKRRYSRSSLKCH